MEKIHDEKALERNVGTLPDIYIRFSVKNIFIMQACWNFNSQISCGESIFHLVFSASGGRMKRGFYYHVIFFLNYCKHLCLWTLQFSSA